MGKYLFSWLKDFFFEKVHSLYELHAYIALDIGILYKIHTSLFDIEL